jgi:hypothetical protein
MPRHTVIGLVFALLAALPASAQQPIALTANTLRLAPGQREEKGSLMVRLKHFDPDLIGWEEKSQVVTMPFVARRDGVMHFDGMAFKVTGPDTLTVHLAIENKRDGTVREAEFRYTRVKS